MNTACGHFEFCHLSSDTDPKEGLCILHSQNSEKDEKAFADALTAHRSQRGDIFPLVVFPGKVDFTRTTFDRADFKGATFNEHAIFTSARFRGNACFEGAMFNNGADFDSTIFEGNADFSRVRFSGGVCFRPFFTGPDAKAYFNKCSFKGTVSFEPYFFSMKARIPVFRGIEVGFQQVIFENPELVTFLFPDFRKCWLLDTDLRKVQFTGAIWPEIPSRVVEYIEDMLGPDRQRIIKEARKYFPGRAGVGDEVAWSKDVPGFPWDQIERLYRELKQNHEDRRDHERASDFHYGEKEMRRCNPKTSLGLRFWLTLYWLISGYGERYVRPLVWSFILIVLSTLGYVAFGLRLRPEQGGAILSVTSLWDWLLTANYSLRVMTLLKPEDLIPVGCAKFINTAQGVLGPLFLGLFALALRQRLKR